MIRRVSSRQRLVSWDSFDATQHNSNEGSSEEESSFEEGLVFRRSSVAGGPPIMVLTDDYGNNEQDHQRLDQTDTVSSADGAQSPSQQYKRKRLSEARCTATTTLSPRFPIITFLSSPFTAAKESATPEHRLISAAVDAVSSSFPSLSEAAAPQAAKGASVFESFMLDDVLVRVCGFLSFKDLRSLCQVNRRIRRELLPQQVGVQRSDYVWKQQAQILWNLPMEQQEWTTEVTCHRGVQEDKASPSLSLIQLLALAHSPVPTGFDTSIFTPCRWARTLRSGTMIVVRGSLRKELEVVPTADGGGPAVRFLGRTGVGDRSVRANAPLPRPDRLLPSVKRSTFLRNPFARPRLGSTTSPSPESLRSPRTQLPPAKWRPFAAPSLVVQSQDGQHYSAWNVAPRLLSYFEVELLPPAVADDSSSSSAAPKFSSRSASSPPASTRNRLPNFDRSLDLDANVQERDADEEGQLFGPALRHSKECVAVGLATEGFSMHTRMPGWDKHSWGYHGDDAGLFHGAGSMLRSYGTTYGCGDTVGCGVDWVREKVFFTLNGQCLGDAFDFALPAADIVQKNKALYPVVGVDTTSLVRVNLTGPFHFDLLEKLREQEPAVSLALRQATK